MSTHTYDLATPVGRVRLTIADTDVSAPEDAWFSDEEIAEFLRRASDNEDLASAKALRGMAAAYRDRMEQIGHYTDDQRGVVDSMLALAKALEEQAEDTGDDSLIDFTIAQTAWSPFARRDMLIKEVLSVLPASEV